MPYYSLLLIRQFFGWLTNSPDLPLSMSTPFLFVLCAFRVSAALLFISRNLVLLLARAVLGVCCDVMLCPPEQDNNGTGFTGTFFRIV